MRKLFYLALALTGIAMTACSDEPTFQQSKDFPNAIWEKDSVVTFTYNATDTAKNYDIILDVRNTDNYPYQNFWIFANLYSPKGEVYRDTLECVMADNNGKWLGKGMSSHDLPILFLEDIKFNKAGKYKFELIQGMRTDSLQGISDIGVRIIESTSKTAKADNNTK